MRTFIAKCFTVAKSWAMSHVPGARKRVEIARQGRRYAAVGMTATAIDLTLLNFIVVLAGVSPVMAHIVSVSVAALFSYMFNRRWVFPGETSKRRTVLPYVFVTLFGIYVVQSAIIWLVFAYGNHLGEVAAEASRQLFGSTLSPETLLLNIAKLLAVSLAATVNFVLYRRAVFRVHRF